MSYNNPLQPVVGVSWYEAAAYCNWLTQQGHMQDWLPSDAAIRLPTSMEWERAARHIDKRRYPWGDDTPDVQRANSVTTNLACTAPVGCFPAGISACGALDMAGNVFEWTATPYGESNATMPTKDFTRSKGITLPGGAWAAPLELLCCGARSYDF